MNPSSNSQPPSSSSDQNGAPDSVAIFRFAAPLLLITSAVYFAFGAWTWLTAKGVEPPELHADLTPRKSPDEVAFEETCSLCHNLPNPRMFDGAGWHGALAKMDRQMHERGITIPAAKIQQVFNYLRENARPTTLPTLPNLSGVEPQVIESIEKAHANLAQELGSDRAWGHLAMTYHAHNLYDAAAHAYRNAEMLNNTEWRWPHLLGMVLDGGIDGTAPLSAFGRAVGLNRGDTYALCRLGALAVERDDDEQASMFYRAAISADPACVAALIALGEIRTRTNQLGLAIAFLRRALTHAPQCGLVHGALATAYSKHPEGQEARSYHEGLAKRYSSLVPLANPALLEVQSRAVSFRSKVRDGDAFVKADRLQEAIACFREALAIRESDARAHSKLGRALRMAGKLVEARSEFERALELDSGDAMAHLGLAGLNESEHPEKALASAERAIESEPNLAAGYVVKGRLLRSFEKNEDALAAFDAALPLQADQAQTQLYRGEALLLLNRAQEAQDAFQKILEERPRETLALRGLGIALFLLGNRLDATKAFSEAIQWNAKDLTSHINLIITLRASEEKGKAEHAIVRARAHFPNDELLKRLEEGQDLPVQIDFRI